MIKFSVYGSYDDLSLSAFMEVQLNTNYRKTWDTSVLELKVIDSQSETNSDLLYWLVKFPVSFSHSWHCVVVVVVFNIALELFSFVEIYVSFYNVILKSVFVLDWDASGLRSISTQRYYTDRFLYTQNTQQKSERQRDSSNKVNEIILRVSFKS